uniref:Uncharacterized protein n=1 Tax=Oryza brachyantha TaxID=4533 RepID=J3LYG2_ORYBR
MGDGDGGNGWWGRRRPAGVRRASARCAGGRERQRRNGGWAQSAEAGSSVGGWGQSAPGVRRGWSGGWGKSALGVTLDGDGA